MRQAARCPRCRNAAAASSHGTEELASARGCRARRPVRSRHFPPRSPRRDRATTRNGGAVRARDLRRAAVSRSARRSRRSRCRRVPRARGGEAGGHDLAARQYPLEREVSEAWPSASGLLDQFAEVGRIAREDAHATLVFASVRRSASCASVSAGAAAPVTAATAPSRAQAAASVVVPIARGLEQTCATSPGTMSPRARNEIAASAESVDELVRREADRRRPSGRARRRGAQGDSASGCTKASGSARSAAFGVTDRRSNASQPGCLSSIRPARLRDA